MLASHCGLHLLATASLLSAAGCPDPGKGNKAEAGYRRADSLIAAINRYRLEARRLPDSLPKLVPAFLDSAALRTPSEPQMAYPWTYARVDSQYTLSFRYVGPGMNRCTFASITGKWTCSGYY